MCLYENINVYIDIYLYVYNILNMLQYLPRVGTNELCDILGSKTVCTLTISLGIARKKSTQESYVSYIKVYTWHLNSLGLNLCHATLRSEILGSSNALHLNFSRL